MEGLLLMIIQLVIQALFAAIQFALMLAALFGRVLAMLLPFVFQAVFGLVTAIARLFVRRRWINPPQTELWSDAQRLAKPVRRQGEPKPTLTYSRRYTVKNFWRSGDRS